MALIEFITDLLIIFPNLFLLELVGPLFTHLSAVEALYLLFLQPISLMMSLTYFFLLLILRLSIVNVSFIRSSLTFLSRGLSVPKDAKAFTSRTRGFSFYGFFLLRVKIMSKPNTSKDREFSRSSGWHDR
jgi:hypothetical protein